MVRSYYLPCKEFPSYPPAIVSINQMFKIMLFLFDKLMNCLCQLRCNVPSIPKKCGPVRTGPFASDCTKQSIQLGQFLVNHFSWQRHVAILDDHLLTNL